MFESCVEISVVLLKEKVLLYMEQTIEDYLRKLVHRVYLAL